MKQLMEQIKIKADVIMTLAEAKKKYANTLLIKIAENHIRELGFYSFMQRGKRVFIG